MTRVCREFTKAIPEFCLTWDHLFRDRPLFGLAGMRETAHQLREHSIMFNISLINRLEQSISWSSLSFPSLSPVGSSPIIYTMTIHFLTIC
jgi:hypothetical protein